MVNVNEDIFIDVEIEKPDININFELDQPAFDLNEEEVKVLSPSYNGSQNNDIIVSVNESTRTISAKNNNVWREYSQSDWEQVGSVYRLIIPQSIHNYANPYVAEMQIKPSEDWENNIPTYKVTSSDSVVITSDDAIDCKILIKGDL